MRGRVLGLTLLALRVAAAEQTIGNLTGSTNSTGGCIPEEECNDDDPECSKGSVLLIIGIVLGLTASIGINLGNNLQSLGMEMQEAQGLEKKTKTFWIGAQMFAVASIVNFAAFAFAPAALLAPLESVQFVTNLLFARVRRRRDALDGLLPPSPHPHLPIHALRHQTRTILSPNLMTPLPNPLHHHPPPATT